MRSYYKCFLLVPSAPPQNVVAGFSSSTTIMTSWLPVPYADSNGIVYAYIISVKRFNSLDAWVNHTQYEPSLQFTIPGLLKHVNYTMKISAVTSKGSGPFSAEVVRTTDEDSELLYHNIFARVESMYVTPEISGVDLSSRPAYWREIELVLSRGVINN